MMNRRPAWLREFERMTAAMSPGRRRALPKKLDELQDRFSFLPRPEPPPAPRYLN